MPRRKKVESDRISVGELADLIEKRTGKRVTMGRLYHLLSDDRIVGAERHKWGDYTFWSLPRDPQITRTDERPPRILGPITEYQDDWDRRHAKKKEEIISPETEEMIKQAEQAKKNFLL